MIKTMFWLAVMWCGLGFVLMILYIIIDTVLIYLKLESSKGTDSAEEFSNMLGDSVRLGAYLQVNWPYMVKLWRLAIHIPAIQSVEEP